MNTWVITAHLGKDPELRVTNSGKDVLNLRVALKQRVFADGAWKEETEWIDVSMFGTRTKWLGDNLKKGMRVCCAGEFRVRRYTTGAGEARTQIELLAHDIEPLFDRGQSQDDAPRTSRPMNHGNQRGYGQGQGGGGRPQHRESSGAQYGGAAAGRGGQDGGGYENRRGAFDSFGEDDDIPF